MEQEQCKIKRCSRCKEFKPLEVFGTRRSSKDRQRSILQALLKFK